MPWKQQYDGVWKSGAISDNGESFLTAVTYHEAGSITFKWKVSSEEGFDRLGFSVDYGDEAIISGTADTGWQEVSMYTEDDAEPHVLEWAYVKDSSGSSGSDCGWVKDLLWRDAGTPVTIAFNANGGTGGKSFSAGVGRTLGYYMKQLTPKRDGYVFDGWWTAKTGGEQVTAVDYVTTDITYYAHWKVQTYSVQFHANGGTGGKTFTIAKGKTLGSYMDQVAPKRDGYVFNGWWTARSGGSKVTASTTVTGNATYYAHWK